MSQPASSPDLLAHECTGLLTLTLNRPQTGNALSAGLVEALLAGVTSACANPAIHTILLRGAGKHLCTGFDLSDLHTQSDGDLLWRFVRIEMLLAALWHAPVRTAVLAQGRTWGAGADLVAACERRGMAPKASFRFPGAQFGLVLGTRRLAERIGADRARHWIASGHEASADEALASGLVDSTVAPEQLDAWLQELAGADLLERDTAQQIRAATRMDHRHADLANLVASAARPGLQQRIHAYINKPKPI